MTYVTRTVRHRTATMGAELPEWHADPATAILAGAASGVV
jgi:hypothetical protein